MVLIKIITTFILNIILSVALNILNILYMHIIAHTIDISKSEDTYIILAIVRLLILLLSFKYMF